MVGSIDDAVDLVTAICRLPGLSSFEADTLALAEAAGLPTMVRDRDTLGLFGWLMDCFSYQGISDRVAADYIGRHGNARLDDLAAALASTTCPCPKLASHAAYVGCGYRKASATCANPADLPGCPVPALPLRKGDLNQQAFSLLFFIRDRCDGDIVGFIDRLFAAIDPADQPDPITAKRQGLVRAFSEVHAVSAKLINMTFAVLLMAGDPDRSDWVAVGRSMVAVDTLVHNFLHRTGILTAFDARHGYGPRCYGPNGCAAIIYDLTRRIGGFGRDRRPVFPRLVQFAIWSFCAAVRADVCNGHRIDDRYPCARDDCPVGERCSRIPLRPARPVTPEGGP